MMRDVPDDYEMLRLFFPMIRHIRAVSRSAGWGIIRVRVIVNEMGNPAGLWTMPEFTKLVPRDTAQEALEQVVKALTTDPK
jgi:hypothetical protein